MTYFTILGVLPGLFFHSAEVVGWVFLRGWGGEGVSFPLLAGVSTSALYEETEQHRPSRQPLARSPQPLEPNGCRPARGRRSSRGLQGPGKPPRTGSAGKRRGEGEARGEGKDAHHRDCRSRLGPAAPNGRARAHPPPHATNALAVQ